MNDCSHFHCYLCFLKGKMKWGKILKRREESKAACWRSCVFFLKEWKRVLSSHIERIHKYFMSFTPLTFFLYWLGRSSATHRAEDSSLSVIHEVPPSAGLQRPGVSLSFGNYISQPLKFSPPSISNNQLWTSDTQSQEPLSSGQASLSIIFP